MLGKIVEYVRIFNKRFKYGIFSKIYGIFSKFKNIFSNFKLQEHIFFFQNFKNVWQPCLRLLTWP